MEISRSARIDLIRKVRGALEAQSWQDQHLIRSQHDIEQGQWAQETTQDALGRTSSDTLIEVAQYLGVEASNAPQVILEQRAQLRIFISHLARYKSDVKAATCEFDNVLKFRTYMAHDSIDGGRKWADEIRAALANTHAGVAFYHKGFKESDFCAQEVGWLLGRGVPLESVRRGEVPFGFAGHRQAFNMPATVPGPSPYSSVACR